MAKIVLKNGAVLLDAGRVKVSASGAATEECCCGGGEIDCSCGCGYLDVAGPWGVWRLDAHPREVGPDEWQCGYDYVGDDGSASYLFGGGLGFVWTLPNGYQAYGMSDGILCDGAGNVYVPEGYIYALPDYEPVPWPDITATACAAYCE